jgi:very-short-patch-repair endonuclease
MLEVQPDEIRLRRIQVALVCGDALPLTCGPMDATATSIRRAASFYPRLRSLPFLPGIFIEGGDMAEITPDASAFLDHCSSMIGKHAEESFSQNRFCEFTDLKMESPIEHMLYTALWTIADLGGFPSHTVHYLEDREQLSGLSVDPQVVIGTYRVDFLVSWHGYPCARNTQPKAVVIECDSQLWHERTEAERRYEKKRDRELLKRGYHVFRFTGKEIKDTPFHVASEVLNFVSGRVHEDVLASIEYLETELLHG